MTSALDAGLVFSLVYPETEKVFFGANSAEAALRDTFGGGRHRCVLIVSSKSVAATPLIGRVAAALPAGVKSAVFDGSREHAPSSSVAAGARMATETGADCLLVVGGSSALDVAKGIVLVMAAADPQAEVARIDEGHFDQALLAAPKMPIYSIPTTLSGSEFTPTIGITGSRQGIKHVFRSPTLTPKRVILDPTFTIHTPERLWASTGLKLLDHCVERILANNHNPFIDLQCSAALRLIHDHLERSTPAGDDLVARRAPLLLAVWTEQTLATGNVGVGLSHALAHQLGARCGVPHGIGSALLLPPVLRFNRPAAEERFTVLAQALGIAPANRSPADQAVDAIAGLIDRLGMPKRLSEAGVKRADLAPVVAATAGDPTVKNNPRPASAAEIMGLLEGIF